MKRCQFALIIFLAFGITAGCSGLPGNPLPTLIPEAELSAVIEMTAQALVEGGLVTPPPTATIDPAAVTPTPTSSPTPPATSTLAVSATPTLDLVWDTPEPLQLPNPIPQAEIQIISPGRLSRVNAPIRLHLFLVPPSNEMEEDLVYQISLYDEKGEVITRETIRRTPAESINPHLMLDIAFEIDSEAVAARLEISAVDLHGRVSSLESTDLILLQNGDEEIKSILNVSPDMILQQPLPSSLIQGDSLIVQGFTRIAPDDILVVECLTREGGQVGSALIEVQQEDLGYGYRSFEGEIPFQVGYSSWIRVQVIARDGKFSGVGALSSVEVLVSP